MTQERSQLTKAPGNRQLVQFSRRFERTTTRGYVLDVGPRFFLLALVSDRIWFDGFGCFRVADVSNVVADPHATFAEAALHKRGERRPRKPRIDVRRIEDLLLSAGRAFPLVTIHCEEVNADVCRIGRVLGVKRGRVSLLEIDPAAKWERGPTEYRLSEITRVDFGGDYEIALHLIGGEPATGLPGG